jgi:hypothetical protein
VCTGQDKPTTTRADRYPFGCQRRNRARPKIRDKIRDKIDRRESARISLSYLGGGASAGNLPPRQPDKGTQGTRLYEYTCRSNCADLCLVVCVCVRVLKCAPELCESALAPACIGGVVLFSQAAYHSHRARSARLRGQASRRRFEVRAFSAAIARELMSCKKEYMLSEARAWMTSRCWSVCLPQAPHKEP